MVCLLALAVATAGLYAQQKEPSHVERFADPKTSYTRAEEEATARLLANPGDVKALADRGMARLHLRKFNAALDDLRHATAFDPASADAKAQLAYGLWVAGRLDDALRVAREAAAEDQNLASPQYYLGRLLLLTGGATKEAIDHLQRAAMLNPEQTETHFDLLEAYRTLGDEPRAIVELRLLRASLPPSSGLLLYAEGLIAADAGQRDSALEDFRKAITAEPHLVSARHDLGIALAQAGKWQEAVEVLGELTKQEPSSSSAAYFYALALQNSQHRQEAEQEVRRALTLDPKSADAYTLLGIILATRGAYAEAVSTLENAARLDPKSFDAEFYLGRARYALRDLNGSRDALAAAVTLRPTDPQARFFLATILEEMGDRDAAVAQYNELIKLAPNDPHGYLGLGSFLAEHGQTDDAMAALRRARELDAQNFEAALAMGRLLARRGQWRQAIQLLREATTLAPRSADAHYQLGLALKRDGQLDAAKKEFGLVDRLNRELRGQSRNMGKPNPASSEGP